MRPHSSRFGRPGSGPSLEWPISRAPPIDRPSIAQLGGVMILVTLTEKK